MNIQRIPVSQINPAPYNPRVDLKPDDPSYIQIKQSLQTFGCVQLLVWNSQTKNLVSGHQRLKVLIDQSVDQVDVCVVDLPIEKEKALNLALNKVSGHWDEEKLVCILEELI
jgi:ParB-like chromosome segregation protein Spo0J